MKLTRIVVVALAMSGAACGGSKSDAEGKDDAAKGVEARRERLEQLRDRGQGKGNRGKGNRNRNRNRNRGKGKGKGNRGKRGKAARAGADGAPLPERVCNTVACTAEQGVLIERLVTPYVDATGKDRAAIEQAQARLADHLRAETLDAAAAQQVQQEIDTLERGIEARAWALVAQLHAHLDADQRETMAKRVAKRGAIFAIEGRKRIPAAKLAEALDAPDGADGDDADSDDDEPADDEPTDDEPADDEPADDAETPE